MFEVAAFSDASADIVKILNPFNDGLGLEFTS